jgi:hypothetical protein
MTRSRSTSFARAAHALLALLAPDRCAACGARLGLPSCFCDACGQPEPASEDSLDGIPVFTAGRYAPPLSKAIGRLKFEGRSELARTLAPLLITRLAPLALSKHDCFVPVPLHASRIEHQRAHGSASARSLQANRTTSAARSRRAPGERRERVPPRRPDPGRQSPTRGRRNNDRRNSAGVRRRTHAPEVRCCRHCRTGARGAKE